MFLNDLCSHGCVSGMVSELIYHCDTHAFYDRFYNDIERLRIEAGSSVLINDYDLKNTLAWFGFEETSFQIGIRLGLIE